MWFKIQNQQVELQIAVKPNAKQAMGDKLEAEDILSHFLISHSILQLS